MEDLLLFYEHLFLMEVDVTGTGSIILSSIAALVSIITLWLKVSFDSKTKIRLAEIESDNKVKEQQLKALEHKSTFYENQVIELRARIKEDHEKIKLLEKIQSELLIQLEEERKKVQIEKEEKKKLLERISKLENRLDNISNKKLK